MEHRVQQVSPGKLELLVLMEPKVLLVSKDIKVRQVKQELLAPKVQPEPRVTKVTQVMPE